MSVCIKNRWVERSIYILFWVALLLSPILDATFSGKAILLDLDNMLRFILFLCPAFLLFLVNNCLIIPHLLIKKKIWMYFFSVIILLVLCKFSYGAMMEHYKPRWDGVPPPIEHSECKEGSETNKPGRYTVTPFLPPSGIPTLFVVFVLAVNTGVRMYFYTVRNEERIGEMEKCRLTQELEYLRCQINPHFLLNTLNNIHALIDIDGRQAQQAVIELSKMMRYILYDQSMPFIALDKEVRFLKSYIDLMRLRMTDRLVITTSFPENVLNINVPTLLFILFVENAFKHGITYNRLSRIDVSIQVDGRCLCFNCRNTIGCVSEPQEKTRRGIGIENAYKRLNLLYGNDYTLDISREAASDGEQYNNVKLIIPIQNDKMPVD